MFPSYVFFFLFSFLSIVHEEEREEEKKIKKREKEEQKYHRSSNNAYRNIHSYSYFILLSFENVRSEEMLNDFSGIFFLFLFFWLGGKRVKVMRRSTSFYSLFSFPIFFFLNPSRMVSFFFF